MHYLVAPIWVVTALILYGALLAVFDSLLARSSPPATPTVVLVHGAFISLADPASEWMTGQVIAVDGGLGLT